MTLSANRTLKILSFPPAYFSRFILCAPPFCVCHTYAPNFFFVDLLVSMFCTPSTHISISIYSLIYCFFKLWCLADNKNFGLFLFVEICPSGGIQEDKSASREMITSPADEMLKHWGEYKDISAAREYICRIMIIYPSLLES